MTQKREFIKGLFAKKGAEPFTNLSIKKADFLAQIESLKEDEKGFINLTMAPQKNDPAKYSVWVNDWKPTGKKPQSTKQESYNENDLPF